MLYPAHNACRLPMSRDATSERSDRINLHPDTPGILNPIRRPLAGIDSSALNIPEDFSVDLLMPAGPSKIFFQKKFKQIRNIKKQFTHLARAGLVVIQSLQLIIFQFVGCFRKHCIFVIDIDH